MKLLFICMLGVLSGCFLTDRQCEKANWHDIGERDARRGLSYIYLTHYVSSCSKYNIGVDTKEWGRGYKKGLEAYCTVSAAYKLGKKGKELENICPKADLKRLLYANLIGLKYHAMSDEIETLRARRDKLNDKIDTLRRENTSKTYSMEIHRLMRRMLMIELEIDHLLFNRTLYVLNN